MELKLEVVRFVNNDVIATSQCDLLDNDHFLIGGVQEFPGEGYSGTYYRADIKDVQARTLYVTQFSGWEAEDGWYHLNDLSGAFERCTCQDHDDYLAQFN